MIYKTAHFKVKAESLNFCKAAIKKFISSVSKNESDTYSYLSLQQEDAPTRFIHYMVFKDSMAEEFHRQTSWVKEFVEALYPNLESNGVEFRNHLLLTSTGFK